MMCDVCIFSIIIFWDNIPPKNMVIGGGGCFCNKLNLVILVHTSKVKSNKFLVFFFTIGGKKIKKTKELLSITSNNRFYFYCNSNENNYKNYLRFSSNVYTIIFCT